MTFPKKYKITAPIYEAKDEITIIPKAVNDVKDVIKPLKVKIISEGIGGNKFSNKINKNIPI